MEGPSSCLTSPPEWKLKNRWGLKINGVKHKKKKPASSGTWHHANIHLSERRRRPRNHTSEAEAGRAQEQVWMSPPGLRQTWREPWRKSADRPENHSSPLLFILCDRAWEICKEGWKEQLVEEFCNCNHYQRFFFYTNKHLKESNTHEKLYIARVIFNERVKRERYLSLWLCVVFTSAGPQQAICRGRVSRWHVYKHMFEYLRQTRWLVQACDSGIT